MKKNAIAILCVFFVLAAGLLVAEQLHAQESKLSPETADAIEKKFAADPVLHNAIGLSYAKNNQPMEAIESFTMAIKLKPDYAEAYVNLGKVYHGARHLKMAVEAYKKAIEVKPDYIQAYGLLGFTYFQLDNAEDAIGISEKAIKLNPNYGKAYLNLGLAYLMLGRKDDARKAHRKLEKLDPKTAKQLGNMINEWQK